MCPHFLHNDANYGVNFLNIATYVLLLSVDCAWFVSGLYHAFIARTNPKTFRGPRFLRSSYGSPMRPHFLHNDTNYGVNFLNITTYVSLLSVDGAWFVSGLYHTFIVKTNPKTLRGLARAPSESALQFL